MVLTLVKHGFTHEEVVDGLTATQVREYYKLCSKKENEQMVQDATAMRIAFHADAKDFEKMCKGR